MYYLGFLFCCQQRFNSPGNRKQATALSLERHHTLTNTMGSAASIPERAIDEAAARTLFGSEFEQAEFDEAKDGDGLVSPDQVRKYVEDKKKKDKKEALKATYKSILDLWEKARRGELEAMADEDAHSRLWLEAALGAATAGESVEAAVAHFESIAPQATQRARGAAPHSSL